MKNLKKKIKLLDFMITIHYIERADHNGHWVYGYTNFDANDVNIYISTKTESGREFNSDELNLTLRHELFHVVLAKLYFDDTNEPLIEWLALATQMLNKQGLDI